MTDHIGCVRGYHRASKAWYSKSVDEIYISFGMYHIAGGTSGEMIMKWQEVGGKLVPKLECYDDACNALSLFPDLIYRLGTLDNKNITEEQFAQTLNEHDFKDLTAYVDPDKFNQDRKEEMINITIPISKAKKLGLID